MTLKILAAALAVGLLSAGAALAQAPAAAPAPWSAPWTDPASPPSAPAPAAAAAAPVDPANVVVINGRRRVIVNPDVAAQTGSKVEVITNGPVPDTPQNRAANGGPDSNAGTATAAAGN